MGFGRRKSRPSRQVIYAPSGRIGLGQGGAQIILKSPASLTAPTSLALVAGATSIALSWVDASDGESEFVVERCQGAACTGFVEIGRAAARTGIGASQTYQDSGLTAGQTYRYRVRAVTPTAQGSPSTIAEATLATIGAPAAPSNLSCSGLYTTIVAVQWADNANTETGFTLQRARDSAFTTDLASYSIAANAAGGLTTYTNSGTTAATQYFYRVRAEDTVNSLSSAWSPTATWTTPASDPVSSFPYFDQLIARPDVWVIPTGTTRQGALNLTGRRAIYSFRELYPAIDACPLSAQFNGSEQPGGRMLTYSPATDTDPHAQDATKIAIVTGRASLAAQDQAHTYLYTTEGDRFLMTWDAYYTDSWCNATSGMNNQKTWQMAPSTGSRLLEFKNNYNGDNKQTPALPTFNNATDLGPVWLRVYNGLYPGGTFNSTLTALGPPGTQANPVIPQDTYFALMPFRWVRYWVYVDLRTNDWSRVSWWAADTTRGVVRLLTDMLVTVPPTGLNGTRSLASMYVEFNTSDMIGTDIPGDHVPFVAYVRNFVCLHDPPISELSTPGSGLLVTTGL